MKNKRKFVYTVIAVSAATIAYNLLLNYLSSNNIISKLLAGGKQASKFELVLCLLFLALRFFLIVLLPGILLAMAGSMIINRVAPINSPDQK